jgi:molecular chaperone HtpG
MIEQEAGVKFLRVDAGVADVLKNDGEKFESEALTNLFKEPGGENLKVVFEPLKDEALPAMLVVSEESRRFNEMMKLYGMAENMPAPESELVLNSSSRVIKALESKAEGSPDEAKLIAKQIYMLATLSQRKLSAEELNEFLAISFKSIEDRL